MSRPGVRWESRLSPKRTLGRPGPCARAVIAAGAYGLLIRPRLLSWGATNAELKAPVGGADIVPEGRRTATMAVTINAPASRVWPWLAQMGCDRAGWYSWDRLDNGGIESARQLRSDWQQIAVGDHVASSRSGRSWFEVAVVDPPRFLALRASLDLCGHPFDPRGLRPRCFTDSLWAFRLTSLPGQRTRLVVSGYAASCPRPLTALGDILFWEPAHWVMQTRQFANLKRRVERSQVEP